MKLKSNEHEIFILKLMLINERIFQLYIKNLALSSSPPKPSLSCIYVVMSSGSEHFSCCSPVRTFGVRMWRLRKLPANNIIVHFRVVFYFCFLALANSLTAAAKKKNSRENQFKKVDEATKNQREKEERGQRQSHCRSDLENCVNWK